MDQTIVIAAVLLEFLDHALIGAEASLLKKLSHALSPLPRRYLSYLNIYQITLYNVFQFMSN